jgi:hypothetical protein
LVLFGFVWFCLVLFGFVWFCLVLFVFFQSFVASVGQCWPVPKAEKKSQRILTITFFPDHLVAVRPIALASSPTYRHDVPTIV